MNSEYCFENFKKLKLPGQQLLFKYRDEDLYKVEIDYTEESEIIKQHVG
jgi:hypothetical protein